MSDSDSKKESPAIPSWQRRTAAEESPNDDKLDVARRFLDDENVKDAPREKKVEFLRGKGVEVEEIRALLGEETQTEAKTETETQTADEPPPIEQQSQPQQQQEQQQQPPTSNTPAAEPKEETASQAPSQAAAQPSPSTSLNQTATTPTTSLTTTNDRPPIVTYPEFLTKPTRPPPLVTTTRLLNTLYAVAGLSTFLYGTSKYVVAPMVETQTDARREFHAATAAKLDAIVAKLEKTVSEVPPLKKAIVEDDLSDAEDPTEMFHRDMGTQTSPTLTPAATSGDQLLAEKQAAQLERLSKTLKDMKHEVHAQSEDMEDIKTVVDTFRDELDSLTYSGQTEYLAGYDIYGRSKKPEPEDEIRKVRDNIRRVKGVLLSTRNFPATTR